MSISQNLSPRAGLSILNVEFVAPTQWLSMRMGTLIVDGSAGCVTRWRSFTWMAGHCHCAICGGWIVGLPREHAVAKSAEVAIPTSFQDAKVQKPGSAIATGLQKVQRSQSRRLLRQQQMPRSRLKRHQETQAVCRHRLCCQTRRALKLRCALRRAFQRQLLGTILCKKTIVRPGDCVLYFDCVCVCVGVFACVCVCLVFAQAFPPWFLLSRGRCF